MPPAPLRPCLLALAFASPASAYAPPLAARAAALHAGQPSHSSVLAQPVEALRFPPLHVEPSHRLPSDFQLNQGKAIDALRRDYPRLFTHEPDFSIFRDDVALRDPSGERLQGLAQYKRLFQLLRFLGSTAMSKAEVTHRLVVTDDVIRMRWCAKLWMKGLTSGSSTELAMLHIDGVSAYSLDAKGMIKQHRLENIVLSGREQRQVKMVDFGLAWPMHIPMPVPAAQPQCQTLATRGGDRPLLERQVALERSDGTCAARHLNGLFGRPRAVSCRQYVQRG